MEHRLIETLERILTPFVDEALPEGGIDMAKSRWQKPGRGYGGRFPDHPDVRYLQSLVEVLYRVSAITGNSMYHYVADRQVRYMAQFVCETDPTWLMGTALQTIGLYHRHNPPDADLKKAARHIVGWARKRKVNISIGEVSYGHFPCGYGCMNAKDAGWTNDLSIFGSGLVWGYEVTGDESMVGDAVSFAEFFIQPWQAGALGADGYWHAGTWSDDMGSWVIGPLRYSGVESTNGYTDEASWVFSTFSCIDYLAHLYCHRPDPRFPDRCVKAAQWAFDKCQFEDGGVGLCGRDDKWFGCTGYAISQVIALKKILGSRADLQPLLNSAERSYQYLCDRLPKANLDGHGVEWVHHTTLADPLVNVGWLWLSALLGLLDGAELQEI